MGNSMFGGLVGLALLACAPAVGATDEIQRAPERAEGAPTPEIVWKGIDCGPGPIVPAPRGFGSGLGPEGHEPGRAPKPPEEWSPPRAPPPVCRPPAEENEPPRATP